MPAAARPATPTQTRQLRDARASVHGRSVPPIRVATRLTKPAGMRAATASLYAGHLMSTTSRAGDAYSPRTVEGYLEALAAFDAYLQRTGFAGDHADLSAEQLNAFLADYRARNTQGGTNTKLRRLRPFFGWLEATFDTANPYRAGQVNYYAPSEPPPSTLGANVLTDLLAACAGRDFEAVRDRAILQVLATGVRRAEIGGLYVEDLDLINRIVNVQALKDARRRAATLRVVDGIEQRVGRQVPLGQSATLALHQYLRLRAAHKLVNSADCGPLWYATRGRGKLTPHGIYRMVKRRAEAAGYDPESITLHAMRHTRTHELLESGKLADGDIMTLMGWKDRSMLDRYARNLASARAIDAVRRAGLV